VSVRAGTHPEPASDASGAAPTKLQRHAGSMAFAMDPNAIGLGSNRRRRDAWIQPRFEVGVVALLDRVPTAPTLTLTDAPIAR
jgi:hypothetical protein